MCRIDRGTWKKRERENGEQIFFSSFDRILSWTVVHSEGHICVLNRFVIWILVAKKFDTMNSAVKTSLGILFGLIVLISAADVTKFKEQCQVTISKAKIYLSIRRAFFYRHFDVIHQLRYVVSIQSVMVVKKMIHWNVSIVY